MTMIRWSTLFCHYFYFLFIWFNCFLTSKIHKKKNSFQLLKFWKKFSKTLLIFLFLFFIFFHNFILWFDIFYDFFTLFDFCNCLKILFLILKLWKDPMTSWQILVTSFYFYFYFYYFLQILVYFGYFFIF